MDAQVKKKWVEALRSGKYQQGTGTLRDSNNRYCCLGVLCDIVEPKGWREGVGYFSHGGNSLFLPQSIVKRAGLDADYAAAVLPELNDDMRASFSEIADWIEEDL